MVLTDGWPMKPLTIIWSLDWQMTEYRGSYDREMEMVKMVNLAANEREKLLLATGCNAWYFQHDMSCKYFCHCPLLCLLCFYLLHLPKFPLTQQPTRYSISRSQQPLLLLPRQSASMLAMEILTNNARDLSQLLRNDSQPSWPVTFNVAASAIWSDHIMAVLSDDSITFMTFYL